jgi:hypothetical protein
MSRHCQYVSSTWSLQCYKNTVYVTDKETQGKPQLKTFVFSTLICYWIRSTNQGGNLKWDWDLWINKIYFSCFLKYKRKWSLIIRNCIITFLNLQSYTWNLMDSGNIVLGLMFPYFCPLQHGFNQAMKQITLNISSPWVLFHAIRKIRYLDVGLTIT